MANTPGSAPDPVTIQFTEEGASQVSQILTDMVQQMGKLNDVFSQFSQQQKKTSSDTQDATGWFSKFKEQLTSAREAFVKAKESGQSFSGILNFMTSAVMAVPAPVALAAGAIGLWAGAMAKATDTAREVVASVRDFAAASGLAMEEASTLSDAAKVLTGDSSSLNMAFFRLAMQMETGGAGFARLGVSMRDGQGNLKTEAQAFEDIRNAVSQLSDATERAQVVREIFGRYGLRLLPLMTKTREEWEAEKKTVGDLAPLTNQLAEQTLEYEKSLQRLSLAWEGLWLRLAPTSILHAKTWVDLLEDFLQKTGRIVDKLGEQYTWMLKIATLQGSGSASSGFPQTTPGQLGLPPEPAPEKLGPYLPAMDPAARKMRDIAAKTAEEIAKLRLKAEEDTDKEIVRIRTDSEAKVIQVQRDALAKLMKETESAYQKELASHQAGGLGTLYGEEQLKTLVDKHKIEMQKLQDQDSALRLKGYTARLADEKKYSTERIAIIKSTTDQVVALFEEEGKQRQDVIDRLEINENQKTLSTELLQVEIAEKVKGVRLGALEAEIDENVKLRTAYRDNAAEYKAATQKILDLEGQKQKVINETADKIRTAHKAAFDAAVKDAEKFASEMEQQELDLAKKTQALLDQSLLGTRQAAEEQLQQIAAAEKSLQERLAKGIVTPEFFAQAMSALAVARQKQYDSLASINRELLKNDKDYENERKLADLNANVAILSARNTFAAQEKDLQAQVFEQELAAARNWTGVMVVEMGRTFAALGDQFKAAAKQGQDIANAWHDAFSNTFDSLFKSLTDKNVKFSEEVVKVVQSLQERLMKAMADRLASILDKMISDLMDKLVAKLIESGLMQLLGGLGGGGGSAAGAGIDASLETGARGNVFAGHFTPLKAFAAGGVVRRPTLGMIGEGGNPEAVIPLQGGAVPVRLQGGGAAPVNVQVFDYRAKGASVESQTSGGDSGNPMDPRVIRFFIRDEMVRNINRGELDRSMAMNYGVNRRPQGR